MLKHQTLIRAVARKASRKFAIRIYEFAICGNHLHLLIRGRRREDIQNFFRVFAGHTAQQITEQFPILDRERGHRPGAPEKGCKKNRRKFWALLIYSRVLSWGREYRIVAAYIVRNTLEALHFIAYRPRASANRRRSRHSMPSARARRFSGSQR